MIEFNRISIPSGRLDFEYVMRMLNRTVSGLSTNISRYLELKVTIQNFLSDYLGFKASYYYYVYEAPTLWLLFVSAIPVLLTIWIFKVQKASHETKIPLLAIQALSGVFTPVSVAWPLSFASYFRYARLAGPRCINIDVITLLHYICTGDIELRDINDLHDLFRGQLHVYGWTIKAYFQPLSLWWIKTSLWILAERFALGSVPSSTGGLGRDSAELTAKHSVSCFDLDSIPHWHLKTEIHRIQLALEPKSLTTLEFTCLRSGIGIMTLDYMLCAIPFLPYLAYQKEGSRRNRKSAPLFTKMQDIVGTVSTGPIIIEDVINISYVRAAALRTTERNLVHDRKIRRAYIRKFGLTGWREDRLMLLWEASLLSSGYLIRWRMIIRK